MSKKKFSSILSAIVASLFALAAQINPLTANTSETVVVLYLSGDRIQAGVAGESEPRFDLPAVIGTSGGTGPMVGMQRSATYYGQDALDRTGLKLSYAVKDQRVVDQAAFEKLVQFVLSRKLDVHASDVAVVINEVASNPESAREQMTQVFFETFGVRAFYMTPHFTSWAMASQMSADSTFVETLITRDEYDEVGPKIIHRKSR